MRERPWSTARRLTLTGVLLALSSAGLCTLKALGVLPWDWGTCLVLPWLLAPILVLVSLVVLLLVAVALAGYD